MFEIVEIKLLLFLEDRVAKFSIFNLSFFRSTSTLFFHERSKQTIFIEYLFVLLKSSTQFFC